MVKFLKAFWQALISVSVIAGFMGIFVYTVMLPDPTLFLVYLFTTVVITLTTFLYYEVL